MTKEEQHTPITLQLHADTARELFLTKVHSTSGPYFPNDMKDLPLSEAQPMAIMAKDAVAEAATLAEAFFEFYARTKA